MTEALSHPAVGRVLGIHGDDQSVNAAVSDRVGSSPRISLIGQRRIGVLRPGKGDAINTGLRFFLEETDYRRLHFFDADIKTFDGGWVERAELALDGGYDAVRHFYPRSPTDGMITAMITRPGFGLLWPDSVLPWIQQPMSGEVAFAREAAAMLGADPVIVSQSDWGIDTALTHRSVAHGLSIFESFAAEGKDHGLYGSLADLRTMLLECLYTLQRLRAASPPVAIRHATDGTFDAAPAVTKKIAYDIDATRELLLRSWSTEQSELLRRHFGTPAADLDTTGWLTVLRVLLDGFDPGSPDWQEIAFRLWTQRVLTYSEAIDGVTYKEAMNYLQAMVEQAAASS